MKLLLTVLFAFWLLPAAAGQPKQRPAPQKAPAPSSLTATAAAAQHQNQSAVAEQQQTQSAASNQSQQANNAGNQQVSRYDYERQTAAAYAPSIAPSAVCATARSGGISTSVVGIAGGASGVDLQCDIRETARLFGELGYQETAALIACTSNAAVRAFNGRACPLREDQPQEQRVTVTLDVPALEREQRAAERGFTTKPLEAPGK